MHLIIQILDGPLPPAHPWSIPGAGAIVSFCGIVRPTENDRAIAGLQYEAYHPMAQKQIEKIARNLIDSHGLLGMKITHSVGWVAVGQCSFQLDIAAPHRREALAAMSEFIDRLKHDVPIWKEAR
jgi:molybdopterin synthase catalytic subunit